MGEKRLAKITEASQVISFVYIILGRIYPGVREGRHLQAGPPPDRRSQGAGGLLHHPLC